MPLPDPAEDAAAAFAALCGDARWTSRIAELDRQSQVGPLSGRAMQQRHVLELVLARLCNHRAFARATPAERRICAFAQEAVRLAATLPPGPRERLRERLVTGLTGGQTLIPLFHILRTASMMRDRGFTVRFDGLASAAAHDLTISREGVDAELVCETVSAEEGRPLHRGDWYALVDAINPELQTWLAAHPGRYLLKMTLPGGIAGPDDLAALQQRISALLTEEKRQDASAQAVLKLDPLVLAGAQAAGAGLPARLRAQFGPEAHLAVTGDAGNGSVFVLAARAGRENAVAEAICRRMAEAATSRLSGRRPGILAMFVEDVERAEWLALRELLELEGATRRFLTTAPAASVVAVSCASRIEMFGLPDAAPEGELRFRNQAHPAAQLAALAPAVLSSP